MKPTVLINKEKKQFEIPLGNRSAVLGYEEEGDTLALVHTFVPDEHRGKGLADLLAQYALEYLKKENKKAIVYCPFVTEYLQRHPEYNHWIQAKIK